MLEVQVHAELDQSPGQQAGDVSPCASRAGRRGVVSRADGKNRTGIQNVVKIGRRLDLPSLRDMDVLSQAEIELIVAAKGENCLRRCHLDLVGGISS